MLTLRVLLLLLLLGEPGPGLWRVQGVRDVHVDACDDASSAGGTSRRTRGWFEPERKESSSEGGGTAGEAGRTAGQAAV